MAQKPRPFTGIYLARAAQLYYNNVSHPFQPLYVASNAVRSNDIKINPLQLRRLTVLRDLATTDATKVYVHARTREIPYQSILDHLFCPDSIAESIGSNMQFFCKSVYLVKDVHVVTGSRFKSFQGHRQYIHDTNHDRYVESIQFIDKLLRHYSSQNVHPIYVIQEIAYGRCFVNDDDRAYWELHIEEARRVSSDSGDYRQYLTLDRLRVVHSMALLSSSYIQMSDTDLSFVILTLQQYLVDLGLYLNGDVMDWTTIREIYSMIRYKPLPENPANINGFAGFNLCHLHSILLKFWYHSYNGLFQDISSPGQYITDFLSKLAPSSDMTPSMSPWMQWLHRTLTIVKNIVTSYAKFTLHGYRVEDANRVTFLAWERALLYMDSINGPLVTNWDKILLTEIRLIYVKYHTNISYLHLDNVFIEDIFNHAIFNHAINMFVNLLMAPFTHDLVLLRPLLRVVSLKRPLHLDHFHIQLQFRIILLRLPVFNNSFQK
jgi:hypothetical protein